jgi:hypothetical protein
LDLIAGQRHISRDARAVDGQYRFSKRQLHAVVLGNFEAQLAFTLFVFFDQIKRAGVAASDLPAFS